MHKVLPSPPQHLITHPFSKITTAIKHQNLIYKLERVISNDEGMPIITSDMYLLCFRCLRFAELAHLLFSRVVYCDVGDQ